MPHFLSPLVGGPSTTLRLRNERTGLALASCIESAFDSATRRRGLLGRDALDPDAALVLAPCSGIHTFFMRFPIDVVFARRDGVVVKVRPHLEPWRLVVAYKAFAAIELATGAAAASGTRPGDRLVLEEFRR